MRVLLNWIRSIDTEKLGIVAPRYLWFPGPNYDEYEMRVGNPPADSDRPWWLKRLNLHIDANDAAPWVKDLMRQGGTMDQLMQERLDALGITATDSQINNVRQKIIRNIAEQVYQRREEI